MKNMTLTNIARACGGILSHCPEAAAATEASGIAIDSRQITPGMVFVATVGERVDGHRFIPDVFARGALAVVCEKLPEAPAGPCIQVADSFKALREIAAFYRQQLDITVVGITGSVGKTSTKEFIASVLEQHFDVQKTAGNFNNEVGLPLTVFSIEDHHQLAVLEMGINTFGEMHRLTEIARPDVVVMTNIGECHLEFLGDRDGVLRAKSEIFDCMNSEGYVVVNGDDDKLITVREVHGKAPLHYGFGQDNEIRVCDVKDDGLAGSSARICLSGFADGKGVWEIPAQIHLPGIHMVYNAMAAAAVGRLLGVTREEIAAGIAAVQPVGGRSHLIRQEHLTVIDDCYNANPVSMKAALTLLASAKGRKVAILGDMGELGSDELAMHAGVGRFAAESGADLILCVGRLSEAMYAAAREKGGQAEWFEDMDHILSAIDARILPGDTVLVKASHSMGFERIVDHLTRENR